MIARRLVAIGTAAVFISGVKVLEAIGVKDALIYSAEAEVSAILLTWVLSS